MRLSHWSGTGTHFSDWETLCVSHWVSDLAVNTSTSSDIDNSVIDCCM